MRRRPAGSAGARSSSGSQATGRLETSMDDQPGLKPPGTSGLPSFSGANLRKALLPPCGGWIAAHRPPRPTEPAAVTRKPGRTVPRERRTTRSIGSPATLPSGGDEGAGTPGPGFAGAAQGRPRRTGQAVRRPQAPRLGEVSVQALAQTAPGPAKPRRRDPRAPTAGRSSRCRSWPAAAAQRAIAGRRAARCHPSPGTTTPGTRISDSPRADRGVRPVGQARRLRAGEGFFVLSLTPTGRKRPAGPPRLGLV